MLHDGEKDRSERICAFIHKSSVQISEIRKELLTDGLFMADSGLFISEHRQRKVFLLPGLIRRLTSLSRRTQINDGCDAGKIVFRGLKQMRGSNQAARPDLLSVDCL